MHAAPAFSGELLAGCGCVRLGGFGFWVGRRRAFEAGHSAHVVRSGSQHQPRLSPRTTEEPP